jgi:hypothetical protein
MFADVWMFMYACVNVRVDLHVCICMCVCVDGYVWIGSCVYVYMCVYGGMVTCKYECVYTCLRKCVRLRGCIGLTNDLIGLNVKQVSSSRLLSMTTPTTAPPHFVQCSDNCSCGVCARVESAAGVSKSHPTETLQLELNCFGLAYILSFLGGTGVQG